MAKIGIIHTEVSSDTEQTAASFAEVIESEALEEGKTYYVICQALVEADSKTETVEFKLVDKTNSDTLLAGSHCIKEFVQTGYCETYSWLGKFTVGSSGGGVSFQQKGTGTSAVRTHYLSMLFLDLTNMNPEDYFFAADTTAATHTITLADRVTHSIPKPPANQEWLIFGFVEYDVNSIADRTEALLFMDDGGGTYNTPLCQTEGENNTEITQLWMSRTYNVSGDGITTWKMQSRDVTTATTQAGYVSSKLFGLNLDAFTSSSSSYTDAAQTTTSTSFQTIETITIHPDDTDNVIVGGNSIFAGLATTRKSREVITVDGAYVPNSVPFSEYAINMYDNDALPPTPYIGTYSVTAPTTSNTINLDVKKNTSSDIGWQNSNLWAFGTALVDWYQDTGGSKVVGEDWVTLWNPEQRNISTDTIYATTIGVWVDSGDVAYIHVSNLHGPDDDGLRLVGGRIEYFTVYPRGVGIIKATTDDSALSANVHWSIISRKTD